VPAAPAASGQSNVHEKQSDGKRGANHGDVNPCVLLWLLCRRSEIDIFRSLDSFRRRFKTPTRSPAAIGNPIIYQSNDKAHDPVRNFEKWKDLKSRPGPATNRRPHTRPRLCKRCAALARQRSYRSSFLDRGASLQTPRNTWRIEVCILTLVIRPPDSCQLPLAALPPTRAAPARACSFRMGMVM